MDRGLVDTEQTHDEDENAIAADGGIVCQDPFS
jgi:hypothetical protein